MPTTTQTRLDRLDLVPPPPLPDSVAPPHTAGAGTIIVTSFRLLPFLPLRAQWIARPGLTIGVTGVAGPERDSSSGHPRALLSNDVTLQVGRVILGTEVNLGRERDTPGTDFTWTGAAATGFARLGRRWGLTARFDYLDDRDGVLGAGTILQSLTAGPIWFFRSGQEGIFSNIEHTTFHLLQVGIRAAIRLDRAHAPFFVDANGARQRTDTRAVLELVYLF